MKCDKSIRALVNEIMNECKKYLEYITSLNENAMSDRQLECIIEKSKKLDKLHNKRFETTKHYKEFEDR